MNTFLRLLALLAFVCCVFPAQAQKAVDTKPLEAKVDKALEAYNKGDHTAFYADFAKSMAAIATEQTFNMMYRGMYFTSYGKYISRKPIKAETVAMGELPLLVYEAEFEKNKKVKISVNFTTEDGALKIMQMQFAPM